VDVVRFLQVKTRFDKRPKADEARRILDSISESRRHELDIILPR